MWEKDKHSVSYISSSALTIPSLILQAMNPDEVTGTMLGTVDTEVNTDMLILPAGGSTIQPRVKHLIGAQLKSLTETVCATNTQCHWSSVDCHPEKKGMLKKSAKFHICMCTKWQMYKVIHGNIFYSKRL